MLRNLRYLRTVLRHKWFVLIAGLRLGDIPLWRLLIHDWTKFSRAEWGPYVRRFEGGRAGSMDHGADPTEFHRAFEHHWQRNPHHWEYWVNIIEMPQTFAREMVADWMGAGRGYTGKWDVQEWYDKNKERILLAPKTRKYVESLLALL